MSRILVYYYAFPHYREEILRELRQRAGSDIEFAAGTNQHNSIKPLTKQDIDFLKELKSIHIGPFFWQRGVARRAISREFETVILAPATRSLTTWAILLCRRLLGRTTYLWGQCGRRGDRSLRRYMQEVMNKAAHGLLTYGEGEAKAATELGTSPSKVSIVNNASRHNDDYIDPNLSSRIFQRMQRRTNEAIQDRRLVLTYIGRMVPAKRLPVLFEAAAELQSEYEHLRLMVIGGGVEEEELKRNYCKPYIDYMGWIYDNARLNAILDETTLIVSPYHMGLLAVDALRFGIPVLVPDNPMNASEVESLTEGINSIRFTQGDSAAVVDAVNRWLRIAPQIKEAEYAQTRNLALQTWSPASVATKILNAVQYTL